MNPGRTCLLASSWKRIILASAFICLMVSPFRATLANHPHMAGDSVNHPSAESLVIAGFIDVFYAYDFNSPANHIRQPFLYNHNRHNEVSLNLGLIRATFIENRIRSNLALQAGTYAQDNYSQEQDLLKHIFEANMGVALDRSQTVWLDAGIFPSHIGFESAVSQDNPTLTRSLLAENSPYFLSGIKIGGELAKSITATILMVNGWQRIARPLGNQTPALGTQLTFHPSGKLNLNWSTFIGSDTPDTARRMRYFNNLYADWKPNNAIQLIFGFDAGLQQAAERGNHHLWMSPVVIARQKIAEKLFIAGRLEYYSDPNGVIVSYAPGARFKSSGASVNIDYNLQQNVLFRVETRHLWSTNKIFLRDGEYIRYNTAITTSASIKF